MQDQQHHDIHASPEWERAKSIRQNYGLTAPQLDRYAQEGLIQTSHVRRPGQTRGVRLYSLDDIECLIAEGIETPTTDPQTHANAQSISIRVP